LIEVNMALEDRVAKLESDMFHLMCGSVKLPRSAYSSNLSFEDWAIPILYIGILYGTFWLGVEVGEIAERHHASHNTPASVSGPVSPPGHDTVEDPR
jgi:hypothetical protein